MSSYITPPHYFIPYLDVINSILEPQNNGQPLTICDIGTGYGQIPFIFAKVLNDREIPFQIFGIDYDEERIEYANSLKNTQNLANELKEIHKSEQNNLNDEFISQWIEELEISEPRYLKNVSFLSENIDDAVEGLNPDVFILNHTLEYLNHDICKTMLDSWSQRGPIIIKTAYPRTIKRLSDVYKDSLTFGVLDRRYFPRTDRQSIGELMVAFPTKRLDGLNFNINTDLSYVFDISNVNYHPTRFETDNLQPLNTPFKSTKINKSFYTQHPSEFDEHLPLFLKEPINSGFGRGYLCKGHDRKGTYCIRIKTEDESLQDRIKKLERDGTEIKYTSIAGVNAYEIINYGDIGTVVPVVNQIAIEVYKETVPNKFLSIGLI